MRNKVFIFCVIAAYASPSYGKVGDVYYCEASHLIRLEAGEKKVAPQLKFKFSRGESKIKFGNDFYFKESEMNSKNIDDGGFVATDFSTRIQYLDGDLYMASVTPFSTTVMHAKCDVF